MIWANLTGVLAMGIAVAGGWVYKLWVHPYFPDSPDATIQLGSLLAGTMALLLDRYSKPGFLQGYNEALKWFSACLSPDYAKRRGLVFHPACRLAFFALPLVFAPFYVLLGVLLFWAIDYFSGAGAFSPLEYWDFLLPLVFCIVTWFVVVATTESRRRIPDEAS